MPAFHDNDVTVT